MYHGCDSVTSMHENCISRDGLRCRSFPGSCERNFGSFLFHCYILSSSSCHAISKDIPDPLSTPIPFVRFPGLHPLSSQSCCMLVGTGRPAFAQPCEGVHWSTSLMSSSLLHQQCPACLVRLTWIVFVMSGR